MRLQRLTWIITASVIGTAIACDQPASSPGLAGPPRRDVVAAPTLAACPVDSTVDGPTAIIGVLGGTLSLGGNSIAIPANAVLQPTVFQIVVPKSQDMKVEIHAVGLTSFLFQTPVQVTLDYSRCPAGAIPSGAALQAVYVDSTDAVLQQMGGTVDTTLHRLTFTTGHLSGYAVAY